MGTSGASGHTDAVAVLEHDAVFQRYMDWPDRTRQRYLQGNDAPVLSQPRLRPASSRLAAEDDARLHAQSTFSMLVLLKVRARRQAGDSREFRLSLVHEWIDEVEDALKGVGAYELCLALDDLLGFRETYVEGLVKFHRWTDAERALRVALNAARDLRLLRHLAEANAGVQLYEGAALPSAVLSEDKALARAFSVLRLLPHAGSGGRLSQAVISDAAMAHWRPEVREAVRSCVRRLATRQLGRLGDEQRPIEEVLRLQEALLSALPAAVAPLDDLRL